MKKSIFFIAQFSPPIHGLSKAVETLYNSELNKEYDFHAINTVLNRNILVYCFKILFSDADLFYITLAQTKAGNIRDLLFLSIILLKAKKCIAHLHGGYLRSLIDKDCGRIQRSFNYFLLSKLTGAIVLSESLRSIFNDILPAEKIFVVQNCVDNENVLSKADYDAKMLVLISQQKLKLLYLSNFIESKGYKDVLALALTARKNDWTNLHFHFAGKFYTEEEKLWFYNYITTNHLEEMITYHGLVSGAEKKDLLKQCNIFVLLTRYPKEGQPISILEAMGNAMVVITTNHAGIPDIVANETNGLVMNKNNFHLDDIYKYITMLYERRSSMIEVCNRNYITATTSYTEHQYVDKMDKVFKAVLAMR